MRRIVPLLLALVIGTAAHLAASADRSAAATIPTGGGAAIQQAADPPRGTLEPTLFGKWWKKFKKVMERLLDFIDGLIDDLRGQPETGGGGTSKGLGALELERSWPFGPAGSGAGPPPAMEAEVA